MAACSLQLTSRRWLSALTYAMKKSSYNFEFFSSRGVSPDFSDAFSEYAEALHSRGLPVIFDFQHLALLLGINDMYLARMICSGESFYRRFRMPKRSGGYRIIDVPHESLKHVQRWILSNILNKLTIHPCAHGFVKGRSIRTNAQQHVYGKAVFQIDLKEFFPSIKKGWVINLFGDLGYSKEVAFYLAALVCYEDSIAQGSPASPAISNLLFKKTDLRLYELSKRHGINYSRYADDITFSGNYVSMNFRHFVKEIIESSGFELNNSKTRLSIKADGKMITGVVVSDGVIRIPKEYRREIKKEIFFIKKYGYLSHISKKRIKDHNYIYKLIGRISYWRYIEPESEYAKESFSLINKIINSN
jgi:hypothetical protein